MVDRLSLILSWRSMLCTYLISNPKLLDDVNISCMRPNEDVNNTHFNSSAVRQRRRMECWSFTMTKIPFTEWLFSLQCQNIFDFYFSNFPSRAKKGSPLSGLSVRRVEDKKLNFLGKFRVWNDMSKKENRLALWTPVKNLMLQVAHRMLGWSQSRNMDFPGKHSSASSFSPHILLHTQYYLIH